MSQLLFMLEATGLTLLQTALAGKEPELSLLLHFEKLSLFAHLGRFVLPTGLIHGTLLIHPSALIRRVLVLVALILIRVRRRGLCVIVPCRPGEILQMCWVTPR